MRRLVDMGGQFASGGYQKTFFTQAAEMLEDEDSAYYELMSRLATGVDHEILKEYGFNLGYNSWTSGAETIRRKEKELGYNIPWFMVLEYDASAPDHLPLSELNRVIREGRSLGVFSYFVRVRSGLSAALSLCQNNEDCAFTLLLTGPVTAAEADALFETKNVALTIPASLPEFPAQMELLRSKKLLCGAEVAYSDGDDVWLSDEGWIDPLSEAGCTFVLLRAEKNVSAQTREAVRNIVCRIRDEQRKPIFLVDLTSDTRFVDEKISSRPCFFAISAAGLAQAAMAQGTHAAAEAIKDTSLISVMEKLMTKLDNWRRPDEEDDTKKTAI